MKRLKNRFEDPQVETVYLRSERERRRPALRVFIVVGIAIMLVYVLFVPFLVPIEDALNYNLAAGFLIAVLVAYFPFLQSSLYVRYRWADLPIFLLLALAMIVLNAALASYAEGLSATPISVAILNFVLLAFWASVNFVAAEGAFLIFSSVLWSSLLAYMLRSSAEPETILYAMGNFSSLLFLAVYGHWESDRRARQIFTSNRNLEAERRKSDALLHNVLPSHVASRLREGESVADAYSDLTVVFIDLVGFTPLTRRLAPGHLVDILNTFFLTADRCADQHGIEKVKTIGDAYLAVAGGTASQNTGPHKAIEFVLSLQRELGNLAEETGILIQARAGIHTGPCVGGVTGSRRLTYDYWGDTVNIASRIESTASPGGISISEATYLLVQKHFQFSDPVEIDLKGIGKSRVYALK